MIRFHAGLHKTGSSALQDALFEGDLVSNRHYRLLPLTPGTRGDSRDYLDSKVSEKVLLLARVRQLIVSDEGMLGTYADMYAALPERASRILSLYGDADFTLIVYLRPQLSWARSSFIQKVKAGRDITPEAYCERLLGARYFNWSHLVSDLLESLGPDRLIVRPYSPTTDVVQDFFAVCSIGTPPAHLTGRRSNVSLPASRAALLHILNTTPTRDSIGRARFALERSLPPAKSEHRSLTLLPIDCEAAIHEIFLNDWAGLPALVDKTTAGGGEEFEAILRATYFDQRDQVAVTLEDPHVAAEAVSLIEHLLPMALADPWSQSLSHQVAAKLRESPWDLPRAIVHRVLRRR